MRKWVSRRVGGLALERASGANWVNSIQEGVQQARPLLEWTLRLTEAVYGPEHPKIVSTPNNHASVLSVWGSRARTTGAWTISGRGSGGPGSKDS